MSTVALLSLAAAGLFTPPALPKLGSPTGRASASIQRYFEAWNARDMDLACDQFADDCEYDDTQYSGSFTGKAALRSHLFRVADALPPTFQFCIDEIADGGDTVGVQWHERQWAPRMHLACW